jgi:hypothetical protein
MKSTKERRCKDCSSANVITPLDGKGRPYLEIIAVELCASCLHTRAQLQSVKEDKLPFPKLLAKIRSEPANRVHREIMSAHATPMERIRMGCYKGKTPEVYTMYTSLSDYWINQLKQG